jgi:hypothetical protein
MLLRTFLRKNVPLDFGLGTFVPLCGFLANIEFFTNEIKINIRFSKIISFKFINLE